MCAGTLVAAERTFNFSETSENETPAGFRSAVSGSGQPGSWKIMWDEVPSAFMQLSPQAPNTARKAVLAQLAEDPTDEHFPLLIFEGDTYGDFTFTTRLKTVRGAHEQMAGIAFRIQNETNYYVLRISSLGRNFRFYKVVDGQRGTLIGPEAQVPTNVWHEVSVECRGNEIRCRLNGEQLIPTVTDNTFTAGKIGFWTKSDSVSYFADARLKFTAREVPAQVIVRDILKEYPRLVQLELYIRDKSKEAVQLIAAKGSLADGHPGGKPELDVINAGSIYYGKGKGTVTVTLPVRDHNGEPIAAARITMDSFPGQTEQNAVVRAVPIVKEIQARVQRLQDLVESL